MVYAGTLIPFPLIGICPSHAIGLLTVKFRHKLCAMIANFLSHTLDHMEDIDAIQAVRGKRSGCIQTKKQVATNTVAWPKLAVNTQHLGGHKTSR